MHRVRVQDLPFRGISHNFVGAEQGDVGISVYLVNAPPGRGPRLHRHPYDKVVFIQKGRARWRVAGAEMELGPGEILVVKAGEPHAFESVGEEPLVQLDVHTSPRFEQEWLE